MNPRGGNHDPHNPNNKASPLLTRKSSANKAKQQQKPIPSHRWRGGCCRAFDVCVPMGSPSSTPQTHPPKQPFNETLQMQVEDLEREVQKQKEMRIMYRTRMERTQDYLRYCLQKAQEHGFLDLVICNKADPNQSPLSHIITNTTIPHQTPTPVHQLHYSLASIVDQAKTHGWYIDPPEIELEEKIGQGSTAEIYRGTWRGLDVAVKCITPDYFRLNENGVTFFAQELDTLCRQRHRFVLQLMGACLNPPYQAWLVTEYLGQTLKEWLYGPGNRRRERVVPLPHFNERITRALEIAQAMQYLHEQKPRVIHRDLKPSNILLDDALHVRVADFGHARFLNDQEMALTGETGTYVYMAPEVIRCEPYNEKCDVYSFGIILNELLTGNYPYIEIDCGPTKIAMEVVEGNLRPMLPKDESQLVGELIHLICLCWDGNPSIRPSFRTITYCLKKVIHNNIETSTHECK